MSPFTISPNLQSYLDILKTPAFESNVPYMYMDTTGNVTVGIGHNLTAHGDYLALSFVVARLTRKAVRGGDTGVPIAEPKTAGRPATGDEKKNDYNFLEKHRGLGHYLPEQLAAYTTLELPVADIGKLFAADLQTAIAICRNTFTAAFDAYPVTCQAALIDIAFNCGRLTGFPTLLRTIKGEGTYAGKTMAERWKAAATQCHRDTGSAERNALVAQWFTAGAAAG